MVFYITFLRALAACLITNAHYTGIYPTDLIANGGLIGDILFFAVSGYCLYNIKYDLSFRGFLLWYGKRVWRVYPPVIMMTAIYMIFKQYMITPERNFFWWFIFPTYYHFVASIIILYIPFFFIMKTDMLRLHIPNLMIVIGLVWFSIYLFGYDKTTYHIDNVRQPMVRFLFMESMLLGAWFRSRDMKLRNHHKNIYSIITLLCFILYFASKMAFSKIQLISKYQFVNQIIIFALLFFMFRASYGLDEKMEKWPQGLRKVISFISDMTLEIYVVQFVIIDVIRKSHMMFPVSWIVLTAAIIASAYILHQTCRFFYSLIDILLAKHILYIGRHSR